MDRPREPEYRFTPTPRLRRPKGPARRPPCSPPQAVPPHSRHQAIHVRGGCKDPLKQRRRGLEVQPGEGDPERRRRRPVVVQRAADHAGVERGPHEVDGSGAVDSLPTPAMTWTGRSGLPVRRGSARRSPSCSRTRSARAPVGSRRDWSSNSSARRRRRPRRAPARETRPTAESRSRRGRPRHRARRRSSCPRS